MSEGFLHRTDRRTVQKRRYGLAKWGRTRRRILERDGGVCQVKASKKCRVRANTVDHIVRPEEWDPRNGDPDQDSNLRASCRSCNLVRHNAEYFREKVDAQAAGTKDPVYGGRDAWRAYTFPVHWHPTTSGIGVLVGYMYPGRPTLLSCPPDCTLPVPDTA